MENRYYKPGEPEGRPYFFYYFVPQPWSSGGFAEICDTLTDPNTLYIHPAMNRRKRFFREIKNNLKNKRDKFEVDKITQGRFSLWARVYKEYEKRYGVSSFNDGEECEAWLDVQGVNEEEADGIVYNIFRDVSNSTGPDFSIEAEISQYDAENRKLLFLINPFTESYPVAGNHFDFCCQWGFGRYARDRRLGELVDNLFIKPRIK